MDLLNIVDSKTVDFVFESTSRYLLSDTNLDDFESKGSFSVVENVLCVDFDGYSELKDNLYTVLSRNVDNLMLNQVSNILVMKNGMPIFVLCNGDNNGNKNLIIDIGLVYTELWKYNNKNKNGVYCCLKHVSALIGLGFIYFIVKDKNNYMM